MFLKRPHPFLPAAQLPVQDSFRFVYSESMPKQGYPVYQLHNTTIPLHSYFPVSIETNGSLPGKMVMHRFANGRHDYAKADPVKNGNEEGWFRGLFQGVAFK